MSDPQPHVLLVRLPESDGFHYDVYEPNTDVEMLHQVGESLAREPGSSYVVLAPKPIPV